MNEEKTDFAAKMEPFQKDFPRLIELGFAAVKHLKIKDATNVFRAAETIRPEHPFPAVGYGYIALNQMQTPLAKHIFEEVLKHYPDNLLAQIFLGITRATTKEEAEVKAAEEIIKKALEKAEDPAVKNLGKLSLEWIEHDIKKSKPSA